MISKQKNLSVFGKKRDSKARGAFGIFVGGQAKRQSGLEDLADAGFASPRKFRKRPYATVSNKLTKQQKKRPHSVALFR